MATPHLFLLYLSYQKTSEKQMEVLIMTQFLFAIKLGAAYFPMLVALLALPILFFQIITTKKFNLAKISLCFLFLLYMLCAYALIIFPLPDAARATTLSGYNAQLIPFHFIADIIKETPFQLGNIHTYLPALTNRAVLQVIFNIVMTIPFGMFLSYYFKLNSKKVVLFSFLLSCFFELTQLSGLYFTYSGSYRLCDIDDLMTNTLGGFIGYQLVHLCRNWLPALERFDINILQPRLKRI